MSKKVEAWIDNNGVIWGDEKAAMAADARHAERMKAQQERKSLIDRLNEAGIAEGDEVVGAVRFSVTGFDAKNKAIELLMSDDREDGDGAISVPIEEFIREWRKVE